ncbi:AraC family transcriptional regulator [Pedobacter gandavensis]|uniref:Helix-turn-helix domain-containing protein n=1 Tax=Pedobacter gandavensis TaxID=2679963 RepID=A0ABR6ESE5_9SPHI|nr:AraC family transcriptional regulator [Pedobacter gandavensis]MBB2148174.1 helix-turn-helix domain-containing protein [Pedobacter gandavensis]
MGSLKQFSAVNVQRVIINEGTEKDIVNDFYEFLYICSGDGKFRKEGQEVSFENGDIFFIRRLKQYHILAVTAVEVITIRFTEAGKSVLRGLIDKNSNIVVSLSKAQSPLNLKIRLKNDDLAFAEKVILLMLDMNQHPEKNENLFYFQLLTLVSVIERNLSFGENKNSRRTGGKSIDKILKHIHKNLKDPQMLSLTGLAETFRMTLHQLSIYFKQEMGVSIKGYIGRERLRATAHLLIHSADTISQICRSFGYADESHFYKRFKKEYGLSPSDYRVKAFRKNPSEK